VRKTRHSQKENERKWPSRNRVPEGGGEGGTRKMKKLGGGNPKKKEIITQAKELPGQRGRGRGGTS